MKQVSNYYKIYRKWEINKVSQEKMLKTKIKSKKMIKKKVT